MRWAEMRWAELSWGALRRDELSCAEMSWAALRWAEMRWAELRWAEMSWAELRCAETRWAELTLSWDEMRWAEMRWDELRWDEMSWDEMRWDELRWDEMSWDEMSWDEMSWAEMSWDEMRWDELRWAEMRWDELRWAELRWAEMSWDELRWDELRWAEMSWDELRWAEMRLAEMSWDEMRWAEMSRAEMSWDEMRWAEMSWAEMSWAEMRWAEMSWDEMRWAEMRWATLLNLSPYALMPAVLDWFYSGPSFPPFPSFLWLQAMGCSSGKHEHELQERYGSRIHGDFDGDTVPLSPKSMNRSENEQYYSEEYHHEQPWDKSFSHPFSPSHLPTDNSMTRSEMMNRTPANVDPIPCRHWWFKGLGSSCSCGVSFELILVSYRFGRSGYFLHNFWFRCDFFLMGSLWRGHNSLHFLLRLLCSSCQTTSTYSPPGDCVHSVGVGFSCSPMGSSRWTILARGAFWCVCECKQLAGLRAWRLHGFFSNDVHDYNPFLHLWSLGVEEQFYLVAPWLLYGSLKAMQRGDGANTWVFLILSVVSIMFGWWIDRVLGLPYYAFYLLPARFWELAAGVILYLGCAGKEGIISDTLKRQALVLTLLQSWTALLFLVSFLVKFEEKNFPLPGALMPVFGTVCFILCGYAPFAFLNQILRFGPIVYIGKISYCIYLWHVPVLALCRWLTLGSEMPMSLRLLSLIPTTLLSMATYHFVEGPIRVEMKAMCTLISSFVASIGVGLFVVLILACRHSAGKSCFVWLAWVALTLLVVLFIVFSCQTDERGGTRNLLIFTCILVFAAFCLTYNYHINVGLHSAQHVMVNPRADERDEKPAMAQSSCTVCGCVNETWTYHLPPESCTENAWNCDRPPAPCFEGTPLGPEDFQPHVPWGHENCMGVQLSEDEILSRCLTPERIRTIWVVGDSHSFALVPCITTTAEAVGMPVHNYSLASTSCVWYGLVQVAECVGSKGEPWRYCCICWMFLLYAMVLVTLWRAHPTLGSFRSEKKCQTVGL